MKECTDVLRNSYLLTHYSKNITEAAVAQSV